LKKFSLATKVISMKTTSIVLALILALLCGAHIAAARGGGGGCRGGGFHPSGGYGGARFADGGHRDYGGGDFDRAWQQPDVVRPAVHVNPNRVDHVRIPTDGGFGSGYGLGNIGRSTVLNPTGSLAYRGDAIRSAFSHYDAFGPQWWANHPNAWGHNWVPNNAWRYAYWAAVNDWFGWGGCAPAYIDYGDDITWDDDNVYSNGQQIDTAEDYYMQAVNLVQDAPTPDSTSGEWMPLGVFAFVQGNQSSASSAMFQLAVNKEGTLGGNYYDAVTGNTLPVHGAVDEQSQRAAWQVGDRATICEAGIANLTQDQAPVLVFLNENQWEQWTLVRIPPQGSTGDQSGDDQGSSPAPSDSNGDDGPQRYDDEIG
jgi:hypothetical protein